MASEKRAAQRQRWEQAVREQAASGLTVGEYCQRQNLAYAQVLRWRRLPGRAGTAWLGATGGKVEF